MISILNFISALALHEFIVNPISANGLYKSTFYLSFENSEDFSTVQWAKFKGLMPDLHEFSICHWNKPKTFNDNFNTLWSYCFSSMVQQSINCYRLWFDLIDAMANRHININFDISFLNSRNTREKYELKTRLKPYKHRKWHHFCWLYSNITRQNSIYWNGNPVGSLILPADSEAIWGGAEDGLQSAFILGQEQDEIGGGFQATQSFTGDISEVNIWNYTLDENRINELSKCKVLLHGNINSWDVQNLAIYGAKVVKEFNPEAFCEPEKRLVIFPKRLSLHAAKDTCEIHGGKLVTPYSDDENRKVVEVVNKHYKNCIDPKMTEKRNWGKLTWLGLKRTNAEWFDLKGNGTIQSSINYSNWRTRQFADNVDCAYLQSDSTWYYNNGICTNQILCTVCEIEDTPVFTMKGICNASNIDWNYYMKIDSKNEINIFEGYKSAVISKDLNGTWQTISNNFRLSLLSDNKHYSVIGRKKWRSKDQKCKDHETHLITLSRCEFGDEFTCDSGHCIDIKKKCDGFIDCADSSDEDHCVLVQIPKSYNRLRPPNSNITTKIKLLKIHDIDIKNMLIEYTYKIYMKWQDERLTFTNLRKDSEEVSNFSKKQLWNPFNFLKQDHALIGKIYLGQDLMKIRQKTPPLVMDVVDPFEDQMYEGTMNDLSARQKTRGFYGCTFQLLRFPFDTQTCDFVIRLRKKNGPQFIVDEVEYDGERILNNFEIKEVKATSKFEDERAILIISIIMSREYINQVLTIFIPSWLIWFVAYLTFFIPLENFNNRFMGSVTSLLVLTSLLNSVQNTLPETAYFKNIDVWFLWYIFNSILMIAAHVIIDNLSYSAKNLVQVMSLNSNAKDDFKTRDMDKKKINKIIKWGLPILNLCFYVFYLLLHL